MADSARVTVTGDDGKRDGWASLCEPDPTSTALAESRRRVAELEAERDALKGYGYIAEAAVESEHEAYVALKARVVDLESKLVRECGATMSWAKEVARLRAEWREASNDADNYKALLRESQAEVARLREQRDRLAESLRECDAARRGLVMMASKRESVCYLIEAPQEPPWNVPRYWCGDARIPFSTDVEKAVRFVRRQDADAVVLGRDPRVMGNVVNVVEHMWLAAVEPPKAPDTLTFTMAYDQGRADERVKVGRELRARLEQYVWYGTSPEHAPCEAAFMATIDEVCGREQ